MGIKRVVGIIYKVVIIILIVAIVLGVAVYSLYVRPIVRDAQSKAFDKLSTIDKGTFRRLSDTEIYGKDGSLIGSINVGDYEYVSIVDISKYIIDGYIAVEDRNFANHNGIDIKAILRAGVALVKNDGVITQGGSTITQQVLKNNVIGTDVSKWDRKILEIFLAPEFEKEYSKADIMEFYCNTNYYQNGCYGVEGASWYYFGKGAKDVSLAEAAGLVGISNNPSKYNPVKHPEEYLNKRHRVLTTMLEQGKITQAEFNQADKEELNLVLKREGGKKESYQVSYAIHSAVIELMRVRGFNFKYRYGSQGEYEEYRDEYTDVYKETSEEIRAGGYKIYTTLDSTKQNKIQELLDRNMVKYTSRGEDGRYELQGAVTLVNNKTGYIEAVIGGRGVEDEYNRAFLGYRQPGSVIKPLVVYAPAFETGRYYPSLKLEDKPIENGPKNSGGGYRGLMEIREAIGRSTNTIAYSILQDIKPSTGVSYLSEMQFKKLAYLDQYNGSMALGGFTYGTTTEEVAKGYSVLVNGGVYKGSSCILKIEYQDGESRYNGGVEEKRVYTEDSSYMVIDSLRGVIDLEYGTGRGARVPGQILAGKTGTTNSNKDKWFCGMSTSYTVAVWVGYDTPKEMGIKENIAVNIFRDIMSYLHNGWEAQEFNRPSTIYESNIDKNGNPTDKDTGMRDIFSSIALNKMREAKAEVEERARIDAERKAMEIEKQLIEDINIEIEIFSNIRAIDKESVKELDKVYKGIVDKIDNITAFDTRESLRAKLDSYYIAFNELEVVKNSRKEIEEDIRRVEEEERKRAEEQRKREEEQRKREVEIKNAKIGAARKALDNLRYWSIDNYSTLLAIAEAAINDCKEYKEYYDMIVEYRVIEEEIKSYINPPKVVDDESGEEESDSIEYGEEEGYEEEEYEDV